jgi:hypothetical protein
MICHLARPIVPTLAGAMLLGSIALVGLSSGASHAQGLDSGVPGGASDPTQDADTLSGPATTAPMHENLARQPAFDPVAERMKYLHGRLRITPAQEPPWANVVHVMQENAKSMMPLLKERIQIAKSGNAIDSLNIDEKLGEAQLDGLKNFTMAFQTLYNSLTGDQKKIANFVFRIPQLPDHSVMLSQNSPDPTYPNYADYPDNSYYPYFSPLFLGPSIGLGPSFFFNRHPGFLPFRPPVRMGIPPGRAAVMPVPLHSIPSIRDGLRGGGLDGGGFHGGGSFHGGGGHGGMP